MKYQDLIKLLCSFDETKPLYTAHFSLLCYAKNIHSPQTWLTLGQPETIFRDGQEIGPSNEDGWVIIGENKFLFNEPISKLVTWLQHHQ